MKILKLLSQKSISLCSCLGLMSLMAISCKNGQKEETKETTRPAGIYFEDVTEASGLDFVHWNGMTGELYFVENVGSGCALCDFDNDGDLDALIVQSGPLSPEKPDYPPSFTKGTRLFRNDLHMGPDGKPVLKFTDITEESGYKDDGYGMGVCTGDYDNDGRMDFYLTNFGNNHLWRNVSENGKIRFEETTQEAGVQDKRWSTSATFADVDSDGFLDLMVVNYVDFRIENHHGCMTPSGLPNYCGPMSYPGEPDRLFINKGDGTFEDITGVAGLLDSPASGLGVVALDFDLDGLMDLYVTNDQRQNFLWHNLGGTGADLRFENEALVMGCAVSQEGRSQASMGVVAADFDSDGDEDLFMTHLRADYNTYYRNDGGFFQDISNVAGLAAPSFAGTGFGTVLIDFENDGLMDLAIANGAVTVIEEQARAGSDYPLREPNQLMHAVGKAQFEVLPNAEACPSFALLEVSRGLSRGDLDNDGRDDMLMSNSLGPARVFLNRTTISNNWLGLRLMLASGRDAFGAKVEIIWPDGETWWRKVATDGSIFSASDPRLLIGMGSKGNPSGLIIHWPDGSEEKWDGLALNSYHILTQGKSNAGTMEAKAQSELPEGQEASTSKLNR